MNILIYFSILVISMATIYLAKRFLDKLGLIIVYITMSAISFILTFKYVTLSTINTNSNCITYITMLSSMYLLIETSGKNEAKKTANMAFVINTFFMLMLYIMTNYTQSVTDTISINMKNIFFNNWRILLVYPLTVLLSSHILIWGYEKIKKLYDNYFITTVTIYLLIGIIEGIVYTLLSYINILSSKTIIMIILSTYMVRLITTVLYSLFLTCITKKKVVS